MILSIIWGVYARMEQNMANYHVELCGTMCNYVQLILLKSLAAIPGVSFTALWPKLNEFDRFIDFMGLFKYFGTNVFFTFFNLPSLFK